MTTRNLVNDQGGSFTATRVDDVESSDVAPGIVRRALPDGDVIARVFDMAPGVVWPVVDHHSADEFIYVVSGELIEGDHAFGPGAYLHYGPGSSHRPRTDEGCRIMVFGAPES